ncbi:T9SS type B sorting domain-containing protein [Flectobacillus rivi]|uniref:Gliding motility-associated C-terminal domain-containing protein n=1 Tax=Flectobacillus rivi TaxID=2984209 RepID=A0ABT6Z5I1_9BACT|nr:gliding motility-associated C-terminal domain-containing protein [Flectobacillus rivi]MDI9876390.1 gliding motility-associated C-terminal domain-containing protein [Flectobacillus rivi]
MRLRLLIILLCLTTVQPMFAQDPFVGGYLQLSKVAGTTNQFQLTVHLYISLHNAINQADLASGALTKDLRAKVFRKRDNVDVTTSIDASGVIDFSGGSSTGIDLTYPNNCNIGTLKSKDLVLGKNITLDFTRLSDPDGYYVIAERCCRSSQLINIANPSSSSLILYLFFTNAITQTPAFQEAQGSFYCLNQAKFVNLPVINSGGTSIEYSFEPLYKGLSSPSSPLVLPQLASPKEVSWMSGYSTSSPIASSIPIVLSNAGTVQFQPNKEGLYAMKIMATQKMGGNIISQAQVEYDVLVKDCKEVEKPRIYEAGSISTAHKNTITLCQKSYRVLETQANPNATYQWYYNGNPLPNATTNKLRINDDVTGDYRVEINDPTATCKPTDTSLLTRVIGDGGVGLSLTPSLGTTICEDKSPGTITPNISGATSANFTFEWTLDGLTLNSNSTIDYDRSGVYRLVITQKNSPFCTFDASLNIAVNPLPQVDAQNVSNKTYICEGDLVTLKAEVNAGTTWLWQKDGANFSTDQTINVTQSGNYQLQATSDKGCKKNAPEVAITVSPKPTVTFAPIPSFCEAKNLSTDLSIYVTPVSSNAGVFTGKGMIGSVFDPSKAGSGVWPIVYEYTSADGCKNSATSNAIVDRVPRVQLGEDITIFRGQQVQIPVVGSQGSGYSFTWSPTTGLLNPTDFSPIAAPISHQEYTLEVVANTSRCKASDKINVFVYPKIDIPNSFTPNGDRMNDTWELDGIDEYPNIEVKIYNRWGNEIFYSKGYNQPFDGIQEGQRIPTGTYYYVIKPNVNLPALTGYVTVVK